MQFEHILQLRNQPLFFCHLVPLDTSLHFNKLTLKSSQASHGPGKGRRENGSIVFTGLFSANSNYNNSVIKRFAVVNTKKWEPLKCVSMAETYFTPYSHPSHQLSICKLLGTACSSCSHNTEQKNLRCCGTEACVINILHAQEPRNRLEAACVLQTCDIIARFIRCMKGNDPTGFRSCLYSLTYSSKTVPVLVQLLTEWSVTELC